MEPRMRAGLIGGGGAAIATFFLSLIFICFTGPVIAILGGFNAGMIIGRDQRFATRPGQAGAMAGFYAGCVVGAAQILGMIVIAPYTQGVLQQVSIPQGRPQTNQEFTILFIELTILAVLLEMAVTVACGVWGATWAAKRTARAIAATQPRTYQPIYTPPPIPVAPPPANAAAQMPPPPAHYPPPPSYYGLPDAPPSDSEPPTPSAV